MSTTGGLSTKLLSCSRFVISSSYRRIFNPDKASKVCQKMGMVIYINSSTQEISWRVDLRFPLRLAGIELPFPI